MPNYIEWMRQVMKAELPTAPIAQFMGFRFTQVEKGEVSMQMTCDDRHMNPMGTLHGGIYADLADAALGCAFATTLEPHETSALFQLNMNILKPCWKTTLTANAKVVQRGKNLGVVRCDMFDSDGRLVAVFSATCSVLRGEQAKGR
jgi:uncharacterized protein (TIGR00369 family)